MKYVKVEIDTPSTLSKDEEIIIVNFIDSLFVSKVADKVRHIKIIFDEKE